MSLNNDSRPISNKAFSIRFRCCNFSCIFYLFIYFFGIPSNNPYLINVYLDTTFAISFPLCMHACMIEDGLCQCSFCKCLSPPCSVCLLLSISLSSCMQAFPALAQVQALRRVNECLLAENRAMLRVLTRLSETASMPETEDL